MNWKPVLGFEGLYEVSDVGTFRRLVTRNLNPLQTPKELKFGDRRGYASVTLCKGGETKTFQSHRLTWSAFNGPIPEGLQINHKNGQKRDNRLDNLEVVTPSENTKHAFDHLGRVGVKQDTAGSKNGRAILDEAKVEDIRQRYKEGKKAIDLAKTYSVSPATVYMLLSERTWKTPIKSSD